MRRPQCPACGDAQWQLPTRLQLEDVELKVCDGGSVRALGPLETWEKSRHHVSRLTGVVTEVVEMEAGADGPIYVFNSGNNLSRPAGRST